MPTGCKTTRDHLDQNVFSAYLGDDYLGDITRKVIPHQRCDQCGAKVRVAYVADGVRFFKKSLAVQWLLAKHLADKAGHGDQQPSR